MGLGGISIWQLLIILVIVVMVFGTKKLRNMGGDLGTAIKGFKKSVKEEPADNATTDHISADDTEQDENNESSASEMTEENNESSASEMTKEATKPQDKT